MNVRPFAWLAPFALVACSPAQAPVSPPLEGARIGGPFTLTDPKLYDGSVVGAWKKRFDEAPAPSAGSNPEKKA